MVEPSLIKKRKPWWFRWLVIPLILLVVVLLVAALAMDAVGRHRLNQAIADARALGQPVTFDEILAQRKVWPPDQDAGRYFLTIASQLDDAASSDNMKQLPLVG